MGMIQSHSDVHEADTVDAFRTDLDEYKDLFEGNLGSTLTLLLLSDRSDHHAKYPLQWKSVKRELDRMVQIRAIIPVSLPSEWVS